jgi:hypothetical protein
LAYLGLNFRVSQLEVVLQFIGVHDADHRDTIFLQDKVLIVEVGTFGQLAEIDAGFGDRHAVQHDSGRFSQGISLSID